MNTSHGILNEEKFTVAIEGKKFKELNHNLQYFVRYLFPYIEDDDVLHCQRTDDYIKPDIYIQWKLEKRFVSLKYGSSTEVHTELLESFMNYLRSLNVEEKVIDIWMRFHFGDGTNDGTGNKRLPGIEVRFAMRDEIKYLNEYLNSNRDLVAQVVDRALFRGVDPLAPKADYLYYGDPDYGSFVSRGQVIKHIHAKTWMYVEAPHLGPLIFRPHARYAEKEIRNPIFHRQIRFTWPNLEADIRYIFKRYNW